MSTVRVVCAGLLAVDSTRLLRQSNFLNKRPRSTRLMMLGFTGRRVDGVASLRGGRGVKVVCVAR